MNQLAVVIAAGGKGKRMGGRKPDRLLRGTRLLDHVVAKSQMWGSPTAISVNHAGQVDSAGLPTLIDSPQYRGPIAALVSAVDFARNIGSSHVLLIGCDMPYIPEELPTVLGCEIGDRLAALPVAGGKIQTLAGLWAVDQPFRDGVSLGSNQSICKYAQQIDALFVLWAQKSSLDCFADIDDLEALEEAENALLKRAKI